MQHTVKELWHFTLSASDGDIGEVKDVYFDDDRWTIRYLIVETGSWLDGRKVLVSPRSVREVVWDDRNVSVDLNRRQVTTDGAAGSVENFVFDDERWRILYMVVDTRKWLPGKSVLLPPQWIASVSWSEHEVYVDATRTAVEASPEYDGSPACSQKGEAAMRE